MASTAPVRNKQTPAKHQPSLLDQMGKAWNELVGNKVAAAQTVKKNPVPGSKTPVPSKPKGAPGKNPVKNPPGVKTENRTPERKKSTDGSKLSGSPRDTNFVKQPAAQRQTPRLLETQKTGLPNQRPAVPSAAAKKPDGTPGADGKKTPTQPSRTTVTQKPVARPADPSLDQAEQGLNKFAAQYKEKAAGKALIQQGGDNVREFFTGHRDDQFKNIKESKAAITSLREQVSLGKMTKTEAEKAGAALLKKFSTEADRVTQAQVKNAEAGKVINSVGKVAAVSTAAMSATVAGGGLNVFAGAAAAAATGTVYDAASVALFEGKSTIAPRLDVNSLGGIGARALLNNEKTNGGDWARAALGTASDGLSGAFVVRGIVTSTAGQNLVKAGGTQVTRWALANASAKAGLRTAVEQAAATTGLKVIGETGDLSHTHDQRVDAVFKTVKQGIKALPAQVLVSPIANHLGVSAQLKNKVGDVVLQMAVNSGTGMAQTSMNNFVNKRSFALSKTDVATAVLQSGAGAFQSLAKRVPNEGSLRTSTSQGAGLLKSNIDRQLDKPLVHLERALNRLQPKPRADGSTPAVRRNQTRASTPPNALNRLAAELKSKTLGAANKLGEVTKPVIDAAGKHLIDRPSNAFASGRSKVLSAGRNLYYPNKVAAANKDIKKVDANIAKLEQHYLNGQKRLTNDIAEAERAAPEAQRWVNAANDPARALTAKETAQIKALVHNTTAKVDRAVVAGSAELHTQRFSKTLSKLEGQLNKLHANVAEDKAQLTKIEISSNNSREVSAARERHAKSVAEVEKFLNLPAKDHIDHPEVLSVLKWGKWVKNKDTNSVELKPATLRESMTELKARAAKGEALTKSVTYEDYRRSTVEAGFTPSVAGYVNLRSSALRAVREEVNSRGTAIQKFASTERRASDALLVKAQKDAAAANAKNSIDVGQAGVEHSELKKLNKDGLSAALNTVAIDKAAKQVETMKQVQQEAKADGRHDLMHDATAQLKVLQSRLDFARRSTDAGAGRKILKEAEGSVSRSDAAAVQAEKVLSRQRKELIPQIQQLQRDLAGTTQVMARNPTQLNAQRQQHADLLKLKLNDLQTRLIDSKSGSMQRCRINLPPQKALPG
jgi:hypothetical protein